MIKVITWVCLTVSLAFLLGGCSGKDQGKSEIKPEIIARVNKGLITKPELENYLADRALRNPPTVSKKNILKFLDEMILEEVLYQEALRLKLDSDPAVRKNIRQLLTQKLIEKEEQKARTRKIGDSEIKKYYDSHADEYSRPAQVRLSIIYIAKPPGANDNTRAKLKAQAEMVLKKALAAQGKRSGFGPLVRKHSDSHEKLRNGDSGFIDIQGRPSGINKKIAEAAFKLKRAGSIADYLIETDDGYHIIMMTGQHSADHKTLESVRSEILQRIRRKTVADARQVFVKDMREQADVRVSDKVLAGIVADLSKERKEPSSAGQKKGPPVLE